VVGVLAPGALRCDYTRRRLRHGQDEGVREEVREHGKEVIIERSRLYGWHKPTRATARQTGIDIFFQNTAAEWLLFLDDDMMLKEGWWNEARE
jgi:hypothetical protein